MGLDQVGSGRTGVDRGGPGRTEVDQGAPGMDRDGARGLVGCQYKEHA